MGCRVWESCESLSAERHIIMSSSETDCGLHEAQGRRELDRTIGKMAVR